jgi:hypothetical protein
VSFLQIIPRHYDTVPLPNKTKTSHTAPEQALATIIALQWHTMSKKKDA